MIPDERERRKWQNPQSTLLDAGLRPSITLVDIGCGDGFFALPAVRIVGETGKVYAFDEDPDAIDRLKWKATRRRRRRRLPNTLNTSIRGIIGETLLERLPEIAASTVSACHSGSMDPSPVLLAMGVDRELALGAVHMSLGRWTTGEEIARASRLIVRRAGDQLSAGRRN